MGTANKSVIPLGIEQESLIKGQIPLYSVIPKSFSWEALPPADVFGGGIFI